MKVTTAQGKNGKWRFQIRDEEDTLLAVSNVTGFGSQIEAKKVGNQVIQKAVLVSAKDTIDSLQRSVDDSNAALEEAIVTKSQQNTERALCIVIIASLILVHFW